MPHVIAIDGPAASGKSSVARALAQRLGFLYVNSGDMYRAVTWHIIRRGIDVADSEKIGDTAAAADITCAWRDGASHISIDGIDPAAHLRDDEVNRAVSAVSSVPRVREILVAKMRAYLSQRDLVMEGRDIGSVVFPQTPFKFYIDAWPEVRAQRRHAQGQRDEIAARDRADSSRQTAPLKIASDAIVIDSSTLSIDAVVQEILAQLARQGLPAASR
ncbi:MAG: (d)CMP kinase [Verrucomicrobiota bacterium]|nr:(d)CMP kinase [Verrucomicrobiota bacterium]